MSSPLVSIGLPVYNGEDYIETALDSIVNQSYRNLEIIICDNSSTDSTIEIVKKYAQKDNRIKWHKQAKNMGAAFNYNDTFNRSNGKYFKWAAHDDVMAETYIERCVVVLEKYSDVVVTQTLSGEINELGEQTARNYTTEADQLPRDIDLANQYKTLIQKKGAWIRIFGVIRTDVLKNTPLIDSYVGSDLTLLGLLGLKGKFYDVSETLFWRRQHSSTSTTGKYKSRRKRLVWFDGSVQHKPNLPEWKLNTEMFRSIRGEKIGILNRIKCYRAVLGRMFIKKKLLVEDIVFAVYDTLQGLISRKKVRTKALS